MRSECRCENSSPVRGGAGRPREWRSSKISRAGTGEDSSTLFFFPSQCPPRSPATASPVPSSARSSLSPLARTPTDRTCTRRGGMFSALSLSQQLRTSIATVSCFGGLSKEPPVSARKGSARRASGASVDDLFDRYAPELELMTAPGTSPSQVRSHHPPEPTPARVRLASHPETQLAPV